MLYHLTEGRLVLIDGSLAQVQLLPEFVFLDKKNEVRSLKGSQYFAYAVNHVLKLDALLFNIILNILEVVNKALQ